MIVNKHKRKVKKELDVTEKRGLFAEEKIIKKVLKQ